MAYHFSSYRNLRDFWEKTILELHELKQRNFVLDFDGKNLREKLEEINDWHRMEIFADDILRKIWQKSTQNVTEYNWDKIFDELPPTNEEGKTFLQEYSWAKNNTIWDFHWNLEDSWNREKELQNQVYNLADIIYKLERTLKYKPNKDDFPPGYDDKKEYKNLSSQLFGHLKKNVLKGEGIIKILHNKKRQEQLINKILGTATLSRDWTKKLAKKSDLDVANSTIANLTTKSHEYDRIYSKLNGKISDSDLDNYLARPLLAPTLIMMLLSKSGTN